MKRHCLITILLIASCLVFSCQQRSGDRPMTEEAVWRLGWRMTANLMDENYEAADLQFDSLLSRSSGQMEHKFLIAGLQVKSALGKEEAVTEILKAQDESLLSEICTRSFLAERQPCTAFSQEGVENKALQMELIRMYLDDQAARGNLMQDIMTKYDVDEGEVTPNGAVGVDEKNRNRLKEIFQEHGFPTRKLVGRDAMQGVFMMIQHADRDKEWQKSQLENIEKAVKNGDLDGQSYAYLYDRIKVNAGQQQRYGTQFAKVDPVNNIVELADTEDVENLDKRRRAMGLMPIGMYKRFMLKSL